MTLTDASSTLSIATSAAADAAAKQPASSRPFSKVLEWLKELKPAPYRPPFCRLADEPNHGDIYISSYARGVALIFDGSRDFVTRMHNWAVNTGVVGANAQLHWYLRGHAGSVAYICPKDREAIMRGLRMQFCAEIVRDREIPVTREVDSDGEFVGMRYDEAFVERLAAEKAEAFFRQHITTSGIILDRTAALAPVYSLNLPGREGGAWGTGTEG